MDKRDDSPPPKRFLNKVPSIKGRIVSKVMGSFPRSFSAQANHFGLNTALSRSSSETHRKTSNELVDIAPPTLSSRNRPQSVARSPLKPNITVIPELQHLDVSSECSVWVAVEILAEVTSSYEGNAFNALNIAIILDDSEYNSLDAFGSACRLIVYIVGLLSLPLDKVAILCTCSGGSGILYPLQPPNISRIEEILRRVEGHRSMGSSQRVNPSDVLNAASMVLSDESKDNLAEHAKLGQVIYISNNPASLCSFLHNSVPVHVVESGVVPCQWTPGHTNGWLISASCLNDRNPSWSILKSLFQQARSRCSPGELTNVRIVIKRTSSICEIEEIHGYPTYEVLLPGQAVQLLVKLHVGRWQPLHRNTALDDAETVFKELEGMLGIAETEPFRVVVTYDHSLLPGAGRLRLVSSCVLRRSNHASLWDHTTEQSADLVNPEQAIKDHVYRKLMMCLAKTTDPRQALSLVSSTFPGNNYSTEVMACLSLLAAELEYQIKMLEKIDIRINTTDLIHTSGLLEDREIMENASTKKFPPIPGTSVESTPSTSSARSASTIIHKQKSEGSESSDEARRIWKHMRKDSQSSKFLEASSAKLSLEKIAMSDERLAQIRSQALGSKRSIGADTLRSISLGSASGHFRSWL